MLCVVCGIGFFITVFAAGYMKGEEGYFRFFAYLGLFIFMMTNLVMGENLIMLYLGWEGVGLCSYLLIGYYYEKPAAREAAKKAFLVNRVGDFGFGLGIMLSFLAFGTVSYFGNGVGTHTGLLELATMPQAAMTAFQLQRDEVDSVSADARRVRQIGAVPALCLAARCDGRPDARQRADPRRHDGDRRRLHDRPLRHAVLRQPGRDDDDRRASARSPRSSPRRSRCGSSI